MVRARWSVQHREWLNVGDEHRAYSIPRGEGLEIRRIRKQQKVHQTSLYMIYL